MRKFGLRPRGPQGQEGKREESEKIDKTHVSVLLGVLFLYYLIAASTEIIVFDGNMTYGWPLVERVEYRGMLGPGRLPQTFPLNRLINLTFIASLLLVSYVYVNRFVSIKEPLRNKVLKVVLLFVIYSVLLLAVGLFIHQSAVESFNPLS